jgi:protein TonB
MLSSDRPVSYESGYALLGAAPHTGPWTLFGQRTQRFRGAFGASLLSHAAFAWLLYFLLTLPAPLSRVVDSQRQALVNLVWLDVPGPGGGGGGGGNRSVEPPRKLETPGPDKLAVPVLKAPPLTPPREEPKPQEPQPMAMLLPVKPMDAGQLQAAGVVENANLAPTASQGSGIGGGAGTGRGTGSGPGDGSGLGPGFGGGTGGDVYQVGSGVLSPVLLREVKPGYTADAMRARIQGEVLLSAVVLPDGSVTRLRVVRSLDPTFGLDEQAMLAVRQWRFKPGTKFGQPVPVQIQIAVGFTMR